MKLTGYWLMGCLSLSCFAGQDWTKSFTEWGCGQSQALGAAEADASQYQSQCESEKGTFSWTYQNGFCEPADPSDMQCPEGECPVFGSATCQFGSATGACVLYGGAQGATELALVQCVDGQSKKPQSGMDISAQTCNLANETALFGSVASAGSKKAVFYPGAAQGCLSSDIPASVGPNN